jgi:hypothetical protein
MRIAIPLIAVLWLSKTADELRRMRLWMFSDSLVSWSLVLSLLHSLRFMFRSRVSLHLEIIALRHQLAVVNRSRRCGYRKVDSRQIVRVLSERVAAPIGLDHPRRVSAYGKKP